MLTRALASLVLPAVLAGCGGGGVAPPGPVGDPVPTVLDFQLAGALDGGSIQLPLSGAARTLERDVRGGYRGSAQLRWPAAGVSSPQPALTLAGLTLDRGSQSVNAQVVLPGETRLFRGTLALTEVAVRFTGEGTSPWVLEAKAAGSALYSSPGTLTLTLSGTLTAAPDCRLATGRAVPFLCGTAPFLGLIPHQAELSSRPLVANCPAEVVAVFVEGTTGTFDGRKLQVGTAAPLTCRTTPAGTAERPAYLCEGQQSGVMARNCAWRVEAFAMPSAAGENFTLHLLGEAESGACQPCNHRWLEE